MLMSLTVWTMNIATLTISRIFTAGVTLPPEASEWPGKKLLRAARARAEDAQIATNPTARDEAFVCAHCGAAVPPHGRSARDHCPFCLWSQHVDRVPGDRAESCHGALEPVSVERRGQRMMLHYCCTACGASRVNQALLDGEPADDWSVIVALSVARDEVGALELLRQRDTPLVRRRRVTG